MHCFLDSRIHYQQQVRYCKQNYHVYVPIQLIRFHCATDSWERGRTTYTSGQYHLSREQIGDPVYVLQMRHIPVGEGPIISVMVCGSLIDAITELLLDELVMAGDEIVWLEEDCVEDWVVVDDESALTIVNIPDATAFTNAPGLPTVIHDLTLTSAFA